MTLNLRQFKTCSGCRCLNDSQGVGLVCAFDAVGTFQCSPDGNPTKPCPKPRNYKQWIAYIKVMEASRMGLTPDEMKAKFPPLILPDDRGERGC